MAQILNHNSFAIFGLVVFVAAAVILLRRGREPRQLLILGGIGAALLLVYFGIRPAEATSGEVSEIQAQIGDGTPVLLEFQSQN